LKKKVTLRKIRQRVSLKKKYIAKKIASYLEKIPCVVLIGISGGLAMENADLS
jgi:hypothetical protein